MYIRCVFSSGNCFRVALANSSDFLSHRQQHALHRCCLSILHPARRCVLRCLFTAGRDCSSQHPFVAVAIAQCPNGKYGADCSCTSANANEYASRLSGTCTAGAWSVCFSAMKMHFFDLTVLQFPGALEIAPTDSIFDIAFDTVRVVNFSMGGTHSGLMSSSSHVSSAVTTSFKFSVRLLNNGTRQYGTLLANQTVSFSDSKIVMFFDDIDPGRWQMQPIQFASALSTSTSFTPDYSKRMKPCRSFRQENFTTRACPAVFRASFLF